MKLNKHFWLLGVLIFLIVLGAGLRLYNYWDFPIGGETNDETAWTLLGASLLQTGRPVSWSYFDAYTDAEKITWGYTTFRLVKPALDHPPLFSLIPGGMVTLVGQEWKQLSSIKLIRAPMVFLGTINVILFAWWLWKMPISQTQKIISLSLFATVPAWVFLNRLVVSENLLITWMLLLAITLQLPSKNRWQVFLIVLLHALLPLTKIIGLAIGFASVLVLLSQKDWRSLWKPAILGLICGVLLWMLYAANYDFGLWWQVQFAQTQRGTGLANLYNSFLWRPMLINRIFYDPWTWLGHIAVAIWIVQTSKKSLRKWQLWWGAIWLAIWGFLLISVGENVTHGWYQITFYPIFAIALGALANWVWQNKSWWGLALIALLVTLPMRTGLFYLLDTQLFEWQALLQRIWMVGVGGIVLMGILDLKKHTLFAVIGLSMLVLIVTGHILTVTQIDQWQYLRDDNSYKQHLIPPY